MPKSKFDAFYYGVGMKLDEASVEQAGKQLEGKLNQVVDRVKENIKSISDAASKGVKNIDTKGLVGALVEAQRELSNFDNFNPFKLKSVFVTLIVLSVLSRISPSCIKFDKNSLAETLFKYS